MRMNVSLEPLDLAALLCSRVCHDVISPVGAIINGLEVLEEEKDPDTRAFAVDLIKKSAATASAKLQFCRLAFGAAGSAGASIDTGDAETVTRGLLPDEKVKLDWRAPRVLMPKNHVKLILNMCLIGIAAIPRGGQLTVETGSETDPHLARVVASGGTLRVAHGVVELLQGEAENGVVDAHAIQPYFTHLVAKSTGLAMSLEQDGERVVIAALRRGEPQEHAAVAQVGASEVNDVITGA
jgi:histidine phosphotransferase ChpT